MSVVTRLLGLAALAVAVFVVAAAATWFALLVLAAGLGGSCGENCYTDVYIGPVLLVPAIALAVTALVVRRAARRSTAGRAEEP